MRLGWPYLDVDREIETREGRTLAKVYEESGEPYFRAEEAKVTREMMTRDQCVISYGAGTIIQEANQRTIDEDTFVVYLVASVDVLWSRFQSDPDTAKNRPNLRSGGKEEIEERMTEMAPVYDRFADITLDGTKDTDTLVSLILIAIADREKRR